MSGRSTPRHLGSHLLSSGAAGAAAPATTADEDLLGAATDLLLSTGPAGLSWWQWLALPVACALAWLLALVASSASRRIWARLAARTKNRFDDELWVRAAAPLTFGWWLLFVALLMPSLQLPPEALGLVQRVLRVGVLVAAFWGAARVVEIAGAAVCEFTWARQRPGLAALVPLGVRLAKVALWILAGLTLLSEAGYPVATLVAGFGIGGIAVALAGQKTVENLFGAFSITADQPFREGDFVRIEDFVGTVESIGLRSTRIRTLDRTIISLPNGKLADMRVESLTARDRIRFASELRLSYGTSADQVRQVLAGLEGVLRGHAKIWPGEVVAQLKSFGDSALVVEVMAWFDTHAYAEFQKIRQEVLLGFIEEVAKAGTSFALPTHAVHLVSGEAPQGRGSPKAL